MGYIRDLGILFSVALALASGFIRIIRFVMEISKKKKEITIYQSINLKRFV